MLDKRSHMETLGLMTPDLRAPGVRRWRRRGRTGATTQSSVPKARLASGRLTRVHRIEIEKNLDFNHCRSVNVHKWPNNLKCQNITLIQSYQTSDNASVLQLNQGQGARRCLQRICPQSEWVARWDASDKSQLMNQLRLQGGAITGGKKSMCCQGVTLPLAVASIAEMTNVSNAMWHMMNQSIQSNETKQTRNKKSLPKCGEEYVRIVRSCLETKPCSFFYNATSIEVVGWNMCGISNNLQWLWRWNISCCHFIVLWLLDCLMRAIKPIFPVE